MEERFKLRFAIKSRPLVLSLRAPCLPWNSTIPAHGAPTTSTSRPNTPPCGIRRPPCPLTPQLSPNPHSSSIAHPHTKQVLASGPFLLQLLRPGTSSLPVGMEVRGGRQGQEQCVRTVLPGTPPPLHSLTQSFNKHLLSTQLLLSSGVRGGYKQQGGRQGPGAQGAPS